MGPNFCHDVEYSRLGFFWKWSQLACYNQIYMSSLIWFALHYVILSLARAGMSAKDIKAKANDMFKEKSYSLSQVHRLLVQLKKAFPHDLIEYDSVRNEWERIIQSMVTTKFLTALNKWQERCEKCGQIGGEYVKK